MRVHLGNIPEISPFDPDAEGLHSIRSPRAAMSHLLASMTGLFLLIVPITAICLVLSIFAIPNPDVPPQYNPPIAWGAVAAALLLYIPLHELLHLLWHPQSGRSDRSILVIWPAKLLFGVYYEGCMSRARWMLMRIAPFVFLSVVPAAVIAVFQYIAFTQWSRTFLEVLLCVNGVGSGADVAAMVIVMTQVPRSASLCFRGGKAYWSTSVVAGGDSR